MSGRVQEATREWVETIISEFGGMPSDALNQVYMRGYLAGHSIRGVLRMAKEMEEANRRFPIRR